MNKHAAEEKEHDTMRSKNPQCSKLNTICVHENQRLNKQVYPIGVHTNKTEIHVFYVHQTPNVYKDDLQELEDLTIYFGNLIDCRIIEKMD